MPTSRLWRRFRQWYLLALGLYLATFLGWLVTQPFKSLPVIDWLNQEFSLLWLLLPYALVIFYGVYGYKKTAKATPAALSALVLYFFWRVSIYLLKWVSQAMEGVTFGDLFSDLGWSILILVIAEIILALPFLLALGLTYREEKAKTKKPSS